MARGIQADVMERPFHAQATGQMNDTGPRGQRVGNPADASTQNRRHADDPAQLFVIPPLTGHCLLHEPGAVQIGIDHGAPAVGTIICGGAVNCPRALLIKTSKRP